MAVARRRRPYRATRLVLAALAGIVLAGSFPAHAGPAAAEPRSGKYYVVRAPVDGQREHLFDIARKTLGNGNRYPEIVELNRGRRQPDGEALVDAMEIRPGWVLELPADANGSGVLTTPPGAVDERSDRRSAEPAAEGDLSFGRIGVFALAVLIILAGLAMLRAGSAPRTPMAVPAPEPVFPAYPDQPGGPPGPPTDPGVAVRRRTIQRIDRAVLAAGRPSGPSAASSRAPSEPVTRASSGPPPPVPEEAAPVAETAGHGADGRRMVDVEAPVLAEPTKEAGPERTEEIAGHGTDGTGMTTLGSWKRPRPDPRPGAEAEGGSPDDKGRP